ncbi:MAG: GatB/YqeY domain-containing protein [Gammaproteobacteria bacterium]|nr:GatB/YqeY domain-containing protein [Gammaproteobacteria bacterium]MCF6362383.1 GatB/YqeY domain-containing protein [Gammaproteobacteria bacterium]
MSELKQQLTADMKQAMRDKDKPRLGVVRLALAAIKQREVDERVELDDTQVLAVLDKMVKQRRDSVRQFEEAGRQDLADQESFEITVLQTYLPEALGDNELDALIDEAIAASGASSMKEMGKAMGILKPKVQGRADMGAVSAKLKARLGA